MRSRAVVVAIMALLLFTGIASSTACEMACTPANPVATCCTHQMGHCTTPTSLTNASQCNHPHEEAAVVAGSTQVLQSQASINLMSVAVPQAHRRLVGTGDALLRDDGNRSSFSPPLRI